MIIVGQSRSPALSAVLDETAEALARLAPEPTALWIIGPPRASDWPTLASWEGAVHALLIPEGLYQEALSERADTRHCFAPDLPGLSHQRIDGHVGLPRATTTPPPAPPAVGTSLAEIRRRRIETKRALPEACGVAWVGAAGGSEILAEASAGWAHALAVIAVGDEATRSLGSAALSAHTALEVDEATAFLEECPAITRALTRAGARQRARQPSADETARSLLDGARLGSSAGSG